MIKDFTTIERPQTEKYELPDKLTPKNIIYWSETYKKLVMIDKEGNKIYTLEDKHTLMHSVDPEVVARVAQQILEVIPIEDWEKKNQDR